MTSKPNPICYNCKSTESLLWRNTHNGHICLDCYNQEMIKDDNDTKIGKLSNNHDGEASCEILSAGDEKCIRKSTRSTRYKPKTIVNNMPLNNGEKTTNVIIPKNQCKNRNRRSLYKKTPLKTPISPATTKVVESVFHKNSYLQVGDIVSVIDNEDNVYYAQIRGLLVNSYCEKSAFLTWLIPSQESPHPKAGFDAATYLIGPDEEISRNLSCLEFVMHAPSNYYLDRTTPYPLPDELDHDTKLGNYVWASLPNTL